MWRSSAAKAASNGGTGKGEAEMSDGQQFNQAAPRGALAEAADRFDRLVRGVKDQQLSETRSGPRIALTDSLVASPEEAWARNFMTQSIGPAVGGGQSPLLPSFAPVDALPLASRGFSAV